MDPSAYATLRSELALACQVMAYRGLVDDILGHISHRFGDDALLVRCRGPQERGLHFTGSDDIRAVSFDGRIVDDEPTEGWSPPTELPIHVAVLEARPDVVAVVHAHPRAVVTATLARVELQPIVGAFDIPATRLAHQGIPTHPRSVLISRPELADEMMASMGDRDVCLLHGHGLVTAGSTIAQAVLRALHIDSLTRLTLDVLRVGGKPTPISPDDMAELPDLGAGFNETFLWRHHIARLRAESTELGARQ